MNTNTRSYILVILDSLVIHCFGNKCTPKLNGSEQQETFIISDSFWGQEFMADMTERFGPGVSWEVVVKMSAAA